MSVLDSVINPEDLRTIARTNPQVAQLIRAGVKAGVDAATVIDVKTRFARRVKVAPLDSVAKKSAAEFKRLLKY